MLETLPDHFGKDANSNNYKLLKVADAALEDGRFTLQTMRAWQDIDEAEGVGLDRIGKDVGQARNGMNDEDYRNRIKVKIRANLSGGEIETINAIATVFAAARYDGLQEGWTLPVDFPIPPKPAMLLLTLLVDGEHFGIPMAEIDAVKGGGVKVNWQLLNQQEINAERSYTAEEQPYSLHAQTVQVGRNYTAHEQRYLLCGTFHAGEGLVL